MAITLPCESKLAEAAIPQDAYYLPENNAASLQSALNKYSIVRLRPGGNYRTSLPIQLTSNQALYGLAGTQLPQVTIPQGTENAILSGVSPAKILFTATSRATKPTQNNCLNRILNSSITAQNVALTNNLFTDLSRTTVDIDTSQKGYLTNNRFIRTMAHGAYPVIKIIGDSAKQSQDNMFIWTNILTPWGEGIIINNQKNISFVGLDAESWNWGPRSLYPGMMNVFNTDFLSVFMSNGGDDHNHNGQYFNLDATNITLQGMNIGTTLNPGLILGNAVQNLLSIDTQNIGLTKNNGLTEIIDFFPNATPIVADNSIAIAPASLPKSTKTNITNILKSQQNTYNLLDKPIFNEIPDPAGANWQDNLSAQADSADAIQALIDQNGIAQLDAGIYYISKPLLLKAGQGIIGAGANQTAIIAMSPTIDLIAGANHSDTNIVVTSFILADLTLQGGLNGINHSNTGSGQGTDYVLSTLSHVTIRNMANAGILINNIYAWDNNYIDNTNFYRCTTGIKQRPNPAYVGGDQIGITFLDKNIFYQTQFIENDIAIDWQANRGNNLNAFINCFFKNNKLTLSLTHSDSTLFANSVFETNSSLPLLQSDRVTGFISSYFVITPPANTLFNGNVFCNDCSFDNRAINAGLIVAPTSKNSYFINSTLINPATQTLGTGLIMNSNFTNSSPSTVNSLFKNTIANPF